MFCSKCGSDLKETAKFCNKCGFNMVDETPNTQAQMSQSATASAVMVSVIDSAKKNPRKMIIGVIIVVAVIILGFVGFKLFEPKSVLVSAVLSSTSQIKSEMETLYNIGHIKDIGEIISSGKSTQKISIDIPDISSGADLTAVVNTKEKKASLELDIRAMMGFGASAELLIDDNIIGLKSGFLPDTILLNTDTFSTDFNDNFFVRQFGLDNIIEDNQTLKEVFSVENTSLPELDFSGLETAFREIILGVEITKLEDGDVSFDLTEQNSKVYKIELEAAELVELLEEHALQPCMEIYEEFLEILASMPYNQDVDQEDIDYEIQSFKDELYQIAKELESMDFAEYYIEVTDGKLSKAQLVVEGEGVEILFESTDLDNMLTNFAVTISQDDRGSMTLIEVEGEISKDAVEVDFNCVGFNVMIEYESSNNEDKLDIRGSYANNRMSGSAGLSGNIIESDGEIQTDITIDAGYSGVTKDLLSLQYVINKETYSSGDEIIEEGDGTYIFELNEEYFEKIEKLLSYL